jgi:RNA polymerase sigma-B factor
VVLGLAPSDRHILRLRFCDDLTEAEIAERTGVTQDQVSRLLSEVFNDLRSELGDVAAASSSTRAEA